MPPQTERKFGFEHAASDEQYIELNRRFVNDTLYVRPDARIIDVGSGTGLITSFITKRYQGVPAEIIGIEPDQNAVTIATNNVVSRENPTVRFIHVPGQDLLQHIEPGTVDTMYFGNNIHELRRYDALNDILTAASLVLKLGGKVNINSTFMAEALPAEFVRHWGVWKATAMRELGATRDKSAGPAYEYAPLSEYVTTLLNHGLEVVRTQIEPIAIGKGMMKGIAQYGPFIEGACGDFVVPEDVVARKPEETYQERLMTAESDALVKAVDIMALKSGDPESFSIPRNWVTIVAKKPEAQEEMAA